MKNKIVLILVLLLVVPFAQASSDIIISVDKSSVSRGEYVTITLSTTSAIDLTSIQGVLYYDFNSFEFDSIANGAINPMWLSDFNDETGDFGTFSMSGTDSAGSFAIIKFKALDDAEETTYEFNLEEITDFSDSDGSTLPQTITVDTQTITITSLPDLVVSNVLVVDDNNLPLDENTPIAEDEKITIKTTIDNIGGTAVDKTFAINVYASKSSFEFFKGEESVDINTYTLSSLAALTDHTFGPDEWKIITSLVDKDETVEICVFVDSGKVIAESNEAGSDAEGYFKIIIGDTDDRSNILCNKIAIINVDVCGDGFVTGDEACDDSNLVDGDGCSVLCEVEDECSLGQMQCVSNRKYVNCVQDSTTNVLSWATTETFCDPGSEGEYCDESTNSCAACLADGDCGDDETCSAGTCECPSGEADCSGTCVDTDSDKDNCGTCGNDCEGGYCSSGICYCDPGHLDCNGLSGDGCEVTIGTDDNCGGCDDACIFDNAESSCLGFKCSSTCDTGFSDCNSDQADGCECDVSGTAHCYGGACCIPKTCSDLHVNCGESISDGCGATIDCGETCTCRTDPDCDDLNSCTDDRCDSLIGACEHTFDSANTCSDGDSCTLDQCTLADGCVSVAVACSATSDGCCSAGCTAGVDDDDYDPDCPDVCGDGFVTGDEECDVEKVYTILTAEGEVDIHGDKVCTAGTCLAKCYDSDEENYYLKNEPWGWNSAKDRLMRSFDSCNSDVLTETVCSPVNLHAIKQVDYDCTEEEKACVAGACVDTVCGDSIANGLEECDGEADCTSDCTLIPGCHSTTDCLMLSTQETCEEIVACSWNEPCGNGRVDTDFEEECDDGNDVDDDACKNNCTENDNYNIVVDPEPEPETPSGGGGSSGGSSGGSGGGSMFYVEKTVHHCSDGLDNDGDGKIDLDDTGCGSVIDNDETNTQAARSTAKVDFNKQMLQAKDQPAKYPITNTIKQTDVCGNGQCEVKENVDSCPEDCKQINFMWLAILLATVIGGGFVYTKRDELGTFSLDEVKNKFELSAPKQQSSNMFKRIEMSMPPRPHWTSIKDKLQNLIPMRLERQDKLINEVEDIQVPIETVQQPIQHPIPRVSPRLIAYIRAVRAEGYTDAEIRSMLIKYSWSQDKLDQAFTAA
jgi:cysteine-rich repeat protein